MQFDDAYKGSFFKAADLNGKARRFTIKRIGIEVVGGEEKVVASFEETNQKLVVNKTNGTALKESLGDELDDWVGHVVLLKPDKTDYQGKRVDCIRVVVPQKKAPAPVLETEAGEETDDVNL